jgi:bifunctional non-homologous end joining protein LigD
VVDGEVCALDERGRPSFRRCSRKSDTQIVYAVFDVFEIDGVPVTGLPLEERRERLEALLDARQKTVQVSALFDDGEALYAAAVEQGLEGVMAKRKGSRYLEGKRTRDWLKIKTHQRQGS